MSTDCSIRRMLTVILGCVRMTTDEERLLDRIVALLKEAGYDPYAQFCGYLETGSDLYITRKGDARGKIGYVSMDAVKEYKEKIAH